MKITIAIIILSLSWAVADAQTSSPQYEARPCARGPNDVYKGSCFYDQDGKLIYWIVRYWDVFGPSGDEIVGYPDLARLQEQYNAMAQEVKKNQKESLSVKGGRLRSLKDEGMILSKDYCLDPMRWVDIGHVCAPESIAVLGQMDEQTIRIPHFMSFRKVHALWDDLINDCEKRLGEGVFCSVTLIEYVKNTEAQMRYENPQLFIRPPLKKRADEIKTAVLAELEVDKALNELLPRAKVNGSACAGYKAEDLSKELSDRLAGIQRRVDAQIEQIQFLAETYKKSIEIENKEDMERFQKKWGWTK